MKIILDHWLQSFLFFTPLKLKALLVTSAKRYVRALKTVLSRFGILLVADAILFMIFGNVVFKILHITVPTTPLNVSLFMILVILLIEVNWFVFSTATLLFIRKKENTEPLIYLRQTFFAYLQLLLFFYLLLLVGMALLIAFGIIKMPQFHWAFIACHAMAKLLITFYWLDSPVTIKDAFFSIEKAVNCFIYNLPIFAFFLVILWCFDAGLMALFLDTSKINGYDSAILITRTEQLVKFSPTQITVFKFLAFRYSIFFIKYLWTSLVFVFYDQKKGLAYSNSCLDKLQEEQPPQ